MQHDLATDLELIGLTLIEPPGERCECPQCIALDRRFDTDAVAYDRGGQPQMIAHRGQYEPQFDRYRTITIRRSSDNGNYDVQERKIMEGRSLATMYVQGYLSHIVWAYSEPVAATLRAKFACTQHLEELTGDHGQRLRILCPACCYMTVVDRVP